MILETFLILAALPFVGLTIFFGRKNGYYNSDDYTADGCAHDVNDEPSNRYSFFTHMDISFSMGSSLCAFGVEI